MDFWQLERREGFPGAPSDKVCCAPEGWARDVGLGPDRGHIIMCAGTKVLRFPVNVQAGEKQVSFRQPQGEAADLHTDGDTMPSNKSLSVFSDDFAKSQGIRAHSLQVYAPELPGVVWHYILRNLEEQASAGGPFTDLAKRVAAAVQLRDALKLKGF